MEILKQFQKSKRQLAILLDPDKINIQNPSQLFNTVRTNPCDYIFIGGSLTTSSDFDEKVKFVKSKVSIPVIIFPGSSHQISANADGMLLLSLTSGRNADLLIGQHVIAAPYLKKSGLEIIPTSYMLIDGGNQTTASYISSSNPIPHSKNEIAINTALASEMLGMRLIYLDCGSGANNHVSPKMVSDVSKNCNLPLITGGGIKSPESADKLYKAGASIIVIGTAIEDTPELYNSFKKLTD